MPSLVRPGDVPPARAAPPCDVSVLNFRSPSLPPIHDGIPDSFIEGQELSFGQGAGTRGGDDLVDDDVSSNDDGNTKNDDPFDDDDDDEDSNYHENGKDDDPNGLEYSSDDDDNNRGGVNECSEFQRPPEHIR